jgi:hypothetical protein
MIRSILCVLAQSVYGVILIAVIQVTPSGAAGVVRVIVRRGERVRPQLSVSASDCRSGRRMKTLQNRLTNCGDETCEIIGIG